MLSVDETLERAVNATNVELKGSAAVEESSNKASDNHFSLMEQNAEKARDAAGEMKDAAVDPGTMFLRQYGLAPKDGKK
jgi:hypothetical protein